MKTSLIKTLFYTAIITFQFACKPAPVIKNKDDLKQEIVKTEKEFEAAAKDKGIAEAFYLYADENAVIKRSNDTLIIGNDNIKKYYQSKENKNATVTWSPDFVEVSDDGTLGYTYGKYLWVITDSIGNSKEFRGVFHTVWKKQSDGSWKYVWD